MHPNKYSDAARTKAMEALFSEVNDEDGLDWPSSFEERFLTVSKQKYAVAVNSGTSGLHVALMALGVGPGDEVISPALTVIMDTFATLYVGATPVFADVLQDTWNIDPASVEALITPRTKAIISVSWFGLPADLVGLRRIADKYGIALIDDSAETILVGDYQPNKASAPDIRVFSFESKKHLSTGGEGGMVTTDSADLAKRIRQAGGLGYRHLSAMTGRTSLAARTFQSPEYKRFDAIGFNYRMTPVTAAIGIGQLEDLPEKLQARLDCATAFSTAITGCTWLIPQSTPEGLVHSYYSFGILYDGEAQKGVTWQEFYDRYAEKGGDGYYANCSNPYLEPVFKGKHFGVQKCEFGLAPVAELLQKNIMAFKTNYLDMERLAENAKILGELIDEIGR